jgi:hypothetical protein
MCLTSIIISGICILSILVYFLLSRMQFLLFEGFYAERAPLKCPPRRRSRPISSNRCSSLICSDYPTITTTKRCSVPSSSRRCIESTHCDDLFVVDDFMKSKPACASKKSRYLTSIPKEYTSTRATSSYVDGFDLPTTTSPYYHYDDFVYKDVPEFYKSTATHRRDNSAPAGRCRSSDYTRNNQFLDGNIVSAAFPGGFRQVGEMCPPEVITTKTTALNRKPLSVSNHNRRSFFGRCVGGNRRSRINRMNRINSARVGSCEADARHLRAFSTSAMSCPENSDFKQIIIREKIKNLNS